MHSIEIKNTLTEDNNNKLNDHLKCPKCIMVFNDPRNLPCGECVCNDCIQSNLDHINKQFNCFFCSKMHPIPDEGFPICKIIISLLKETATQDDAKLIALKRLANEIRQIKDVISALTTQVNRNEINISEHCEMVRNQIDLRTESVIQKIENYKEKLIQDVDDYEVRCKRQIEKFDKRKFEQIIEENLKLFLIYQNKHQEQNYEDIDESEMVKLTDDISRQKNILLDEMKNVEFEIFNEKKLKFKSCKEEDDSIDLSTIGSIIYQPLRSFSLDKPIDKVKIGSKIKFSLKSDFILVLDDGHFVILHKHRPADYTINLFNKDANLLKQSTSTKIFNSFFQLVTCNSIENKILINYFSLGSYHLVILDQEFKVVNKIDCRKRYTSICGDCDLIIGLSEGQVDVYGSNLEKQLKTINIHSIEPPLMSEEIGENVLQIETSNKKYISREDSKVRIVDVDSSKQTGLITVNAYQMIVNKDNIHLIILKENGEYEFQIYDFNGNLKSKYTLIGFTNKCFLSYNNDKINFLLNEETKEFSKY
jgi:hypothetical protein